MRTADINLLPPSGRLLIYQGQHSQFSAFYRNKSDRTKRDLSQWTNWRAIWKPDHSAGDSEIVEFAVALVGTTDIVVTISPTAAAQLSPLGTWELEALDGEGERRTVIAGPCETRADVGGTP